MRSKKEAARGYQRPEFEETVQETAYVEAAPAETPVFEETEENG